MSRTVLICNWFDVEDNLGNSTGRKELLVDVAYNELTGEVVTVPNLPPMYFDAIYDTNLMEYVCEV